MADRDERGQQEALDDWTRWSSVARGRIPASWAEELKRDPLLRRARVCVDAVFGREHRVLASTEAMSCLTMAGRTRTIQDLLISAEPELVDELEPGDAGPQNRTIQATLPGYAVLPATIRTRRRPLSGLGEVSLVFPGMLWEDRIVHLRGPFSGGVLHGGDDEVVQFALTDPRIGGASVPPWILDTTRWSELSTTSVGQRVPLIVGAGRVPCLRVASSADGGLDKFLVGYGALTIDSCRMNGITSVAFTESQTVDDLGLPVTLATFTAGDGFVNDFDACYVRAHEADANTTTIFQAMKRLLRDYGRVDPVRISDRLFGEAEARAGETGIGSGARTSPMIVVNEPTPALDYITGTFCEEYPWISMAWDGPGIGPIVVDHRSTPVAILTVGTYPLIDRAAGAYYEERGTDDLVTRVILKYDYQPSLDSYGAVERRTPDNTTLCEEAQGYLNGGENEIRIDAVTIGDNPTAAFTADWIVEHHSRPSVDVVLDAYPVAWLRLRIGDPVRFSDAERGYTDEEALVIMRVWARGSVELTLRIWPRIWGAIDGGSYPFSG